MFQLPIVEGISAYVMTS